MSDNNPRRRAYSRIELGLPVDVQQGGSIWKQRLINLSLAGVATDQPDLWDAQYNEAFTLTIHISETETLELHAYLQHVESGCLGFAVQHVDEENIHRLRDILADVIDDEAQLDMELERLRE